jgi:hypothetical protein
MSIGLLIRRPWVRAPSASLISGCGARSWVKTSEGVRKPPLSDRELRIFAWVVYLIDGRRELGLTRLELKVPELAGSYPRTRADNISRPLEMYKSIDLKAWLQWPQPAPKTPERAKHKRECPPSGP